MAKLLSVLTLILFFGCSNMKQKELKPDLSTKISLQIDYAIQLAEALKDSVLDSPRTIEAGKLLATLSSPEFLATIGENGGFLLKHSTGHLPHNSEIDVPIVYADYYYLESIIKEKNMKRIKQNRKIQT